LAEQVRSRLRLSGLSFNDAVRRHLKTDLHGNISAPWRFRHDIKVDVCLACILTDTGNRSVTQDIPMRIGITLAETS
jgi:hypothetical protein